MSARPAPCEGSEGKSFLPLPGAKGVLDLWQYPSHLCPRAQVASLCLLIPSCPYKDTCPWTQHPPSIQDDLTLSAYVHALSVMSSSFVTLWTIAYQAPLSMGLSRQEYCSKLSFPPPENLPDPKIKSTSLASPSLAGRVFVS